MLEERTKILLNYVLDYCSSGGYKIISEQELLNAYGERYDIDRQELAEIIKYLKENSFISVKYAGGGEYCLMPLPKGRVYQEEQNSATYREIILQKTTLKYSFLGAFIGGLTAILIGVVLAVVLC